jgi:hypothetical protein
MAEAERYILIFLILALLLALGLIFGPGIANRNKEKDSSDGDSRSSNPPNTPEPTRNPETVPSRPETPEDPRKKFDFLNDFRRFRRFMNERNSQSLDMGPLSCSSAFSEAYYSGSISLDHTPLEVVEKIVSLYQEDRNLRNILNLENEDVSERDALNEIQSTLELYEKIENREFL